MPSSKSKKRGRKGKARQKPIERLRQKLANGPLQGMPIVIEPKGQAKMSDVLERFVEPYLDSVETAEDHRKLFTLAALAWNASFLPRIEQERMIDDMMGGGLPAAVGELKTGLSEIVHALIARKQALFADNTRKIITVDVTETADGFHLSVASTL